MKQLSSVERAIKDVPFFAARYENFIKRLENQGASESTDAKIVKHICGKDEVLSYPKGDLTIYGRKIRE